MEISKLKTLATPNINDVLPILDIDGGVSGKPILRKASLQSILALASNTFDPTSVNNSIATLATTNSIQDTNISNLQSSVNTNSTTITNLQTSDTSQNSAIATLQSQVSGLQSSGSGIIQPTTLLLLHGEGSNNGTAITDSSTYNRTATRFGNPVTSTTQKKFGSSSLYFDGSSYITFPTATDIDLKRNNFAIQVWVYPLSVSNTRVIIDRYNATIPFSWQFAIVNGKLNFYIRSSDASSSLVNLFGDTTLSLNTLYYVGVKSVGGIITLWVNGELDSLTVASANLSFSLPITVGRQGNSASNFFLGYIDELRFQKLGDTDLLTVPTSAFTG